MEKGYPPPSWNSINLEIFIHGQIFMNIEIWRLSLYMRHYNTQVKFEIFVMGDSHAFSFDS